VRPGVLLFAALALALAAGACDDDEPARPTAMGTAPSYVPLTPAGQAVAHGQDGSAAKAGSSSGSGSGASASVLVKAPKAVAAVACGDKPAPACPLAAWMKANATPAITTQDYDALADVLDKTVALAPPGYVNWASIARDGAAAARVQSLDAVKASCRSCHNQFRGRYKAEMRARPLPI